MSYFVTSLWWRIWETSYLLKLKYGVISAFLEVLLHHNTVFRKTINCLNYITSNHSTWAEVKLKPNFAVNCKFFCDHIFLFCVEREDLRTSSLSFVSLSWSRIQPLVGLEYTHGLVSEVLLELQNLNSSKSSGSTAIPIKYGTLKCVLCIFHQY